MVQRGRSGGGLLAAAARQREALEQEQDTAPGLSVVPDTIDDAAPAPDGSTAASEPAGPAVAEPGGGATGGPVLTPQSTPAPSPTPVTVPAPTSTSKAPAKRAASRRTPAPPPVTVSGPAYTRMDRKEVLLWPHQSDQLALTTARLVRQRRRGGTVDAPRLTENTLLRVALDYYLASGKVTGVTENDLRAAVGLPSVETVSDSED